MVGRERRACETRDDKGKQYLNMVEDCCDLVLSESCRSITKVSGTISYTYYDEIKVLLGYSREEKICRSRMDQSICRLLLLLFESSVREIQVYGFIMSGVQDTANAYPFVTEY